MKAWLRAFAVGILFLAGRAEATLVAPEPPAYKPAQILSPALSARVQGIQGRAELVRSLQLAELDMKTTVRGVVAQTTISARFENPGSETLEGEFRLALPAGSVVNGYGLDLDGRMVSGVLVEKPKAKAVYESIVRRAVDPGLAEVDGNLFTTRVYPIFPGKGRTIRLSFATPLTPGKGFVLPLRTETPVKRFSLKVDALSMGAQPALELPVRHTAEWWRSGEKLRATVELENAVLDGVFAVRPETRSQTLLSRHASGDAFVQVADLAERAAGDKPQPDRVRIYWDRSLSRRDDRLEDEIRLVERYIQAIKPVSVEIVRFNSSGVERRAVNSAEQAAKLLRETVYRGATSTAVLESANATAADACLLFSGGRVTIDNKAETLGGDCALTTVSSDANADRPNLSRLARKAGGVHIDLSTADHEQALSRLVQGGARVVDVRNASGKPLNFLPLPAEPNAWALIAEAPAGEAVIVRVAGLAQRTREFRYAVPRAAENFEGDGALWAQVQINALDRPEDRDRMRRMSRRFSVAGPDMSFLVLELPTDYVNAEIEPPADYGEAARARYDKLKAEAEARKKHQSERRLEQVVQDWEEHKRWWKTRFDPYAKPKRPQPTKNGAFVPPADMPLELPPPPITTQSVVLMPEPPRVTAPAPPPMPSGSGKVVVTGARQAPPSGMTSPAAVVAAENETSQVQGAIKLTSWTPDRPYLEALDETIGRGGATGSDFEATFAAQEKQHGALPAFYLDVAEWLYRKGRKEQAVEMLLSALELPTANDETRSVVADRLMRYGAVNRAVWIREYLAARDDARPHPLRSLALALMHRASLTKGDAAKKDLQRAVKLLSDIVSKRWDGHYQEMDLIALMDANDAIARLKALGVTRFDLDPRLIDLRDMDLRIVIDWNTAATEVDLWVDEPNGETAFWSFPKTAIGGYVINHTTHGFGPEEYHLRRAPRGEFKVRVHLYSSDRLNPNGASTVTARIIRNFGRRTQSEKIVDLELSREQKARDRKVGAQLLGTVVIGPRKKNAR